MYQCFIFIRNIGYLTPKIIYFHYLFFIFLKYPKIHFLILKKEALVGTLMIAGRGVNQ